MSKGYRGQVLSGVGTVSLKLGCKYRVIMKIGSLSAHSGTDLSTDYGADQLLLSVTLKHSAAEAGVRDYLQITYVDGSLDYGPA